MVIVMFLNIDEVVCCIGEVLCDKLYIIELFFIEYILLVVLVFNVNIIVKM